MSNKHCLACEKPVQFVCACCHTAGYCSRECQKRDWPLYHRYEQLVLTQPALNLDASHRTQERQSRHRDVFTRRVKPVLRGKRAKRAKPSREQVEAELRRQGRAPRTPNVPEEIEVEQQQQQQEEEEEMIEEMVRNTMPPELQRFVDARPLVSQERDETLAAAREAAVVRWGETAVSAVPMESEQPTLWRRPEDLRREVEVAFLGQLEELRGRMRELGLDREPTPQHQTAIAHYLRMAEVAQLKLGLAMLSRSLPHDVEARHYRWALDEFNQRLTHSLFFEDLEGAPEYEAVARQCDETQVKEFGRHQGVYLYQEAMRATLDALAAEAPVQFSGKDDPDSSPEAKQTHFENMRRMFASLGDTLVGHISTVVNGFVAVLTGHAKAHYETAFNEGQTSERYARNSSQLADEVGASFCRCLEADEANEAAGFWAHFKDDVRWGLSTPGKVYRSLPTLKEAAATFGAVCVTSLALYYTGLYWVGAESAGSNLRNITESVTVISNTVAMAHNRTLNETEQALAFKKSTESLLAQSEEAGFRLHEYNASTIASVNVTKENINYQIGVQLASYIPLVNAEITKLQSNISLSGRPFDADERKAMDSMAEALADLRVLFEKYPDTAYDEKMHKIQTILYLIDTIKGLGEKIGGLVTWQAFKDLLEQFHSFVTLVLGNNEALVADLKAIQLENEQIGLNAVEAQTKILRSEIHSPYMNRVFGSLCFDTSRLSQTANYATFAVSLAVTTLGLANAKLWLHQCEDRMHRLFDLVSHFDTNGYTSLWNYGSALFSPTCGTMVTLFYAIHAVLAVAFATGKIVGWASTIASWIPGASYLGLRPLDTERALREWWNRPAQSDQPTEEQLQPYDNPALRNRARAIVDGLFDEEDDEEGGVRSEKERMRHIVEYLQEMLKKGVVMTNQVYGLAMAYLRDEILRKQREAANETLQKQYEEALGELPTVALYNTGTERQRFTLNAYAYTMAQLDLMNPRTNSGFWRTLTGAFDAVRGPVGQSVYQLAGWAAWAHQAMQLKDFVCFVCDNLITMPIAWAGATASVALAVGVFKAANWRWVKQAVSGLGMMKRGNVLRGLIPLGGALIKAVQASQFFFCASIYAFKFLAPLLSVGGWILSLPAALASSVGSVLEAIPGVRSVYWNGRWFLSTGELGEADFLSWLVGWTNTAELHAEAQRSAKHVIEADLQLQRAYPEVMDLANRHSGFMNGLLNTTAVISNRTTVTGNVSTVALRTDPDVLRQALIEFTVPARKFKEELEKVSIQPYFTSELNPRAHSPDEPGNWGTEL